MISEHERIEAEVQQVLSFREVANFAVSALDVQHSVQKLRHNSAPGPDGILPVFLKYSPSSVFACLAELFSLSWNHGYLPPDWRSANVITLYKGKGPRSDSSKVLPGYNL